MRRDVGLVLPRAGIRAAQTDNRPAIVFAGLDPVDLIAAVGAHLRQEDLPARALVFVDALDDTELVVRFQQTARVSGAGS